MSTASTAAPITQAITMPAMAPPDRPLLDVPEAAVASAGVERPLAARTSEGSCFRVHAIERDLQNTVDMNGLQPEHGVSC